MPLPTIFSYRDTMTKLFPNEQYIKDQEQIWNAVNDRYHALDFDIRKIEGEMRESQRRLDVMWVTRDTLYKWLKEQLRDTP